MTIESDDAATTAARTGNPAVPRADTVGSLLRDDAVVRAARRAGPADHALLDDAARDAIRLQEEARLEVITDGEVRRVFWAQTPRFVDAFPPATGRTDDEPAAAGVRHGPGRLVRAARRCPPGHCGRPRPGQHQVSRREHGPEVLSRIKAAAGYKPLAELALSTQCGFASVPVANPLTPADQRAKLELVVEVARRAWPG